MNDLGLGKRRVRGDGLKGFGILTAIGEQGLTPGTVISPKVVGQFPGRGALGS